MAKVSSGLSLSTNYFMRNYYANNRDVIKNSGRNDYTKIELSFEDSRALTRASKRLLNNDYGSETDEKDNDISDTTRSSIEAFVTTYNNAIDSSKTTDSHDTKRYLKQLKSLTSKYSSELSEIGITVERSGKLTVNEDTFLRLPIIPRCEKFSHRIRNIQRKPIPSAANSTMPSATTLFPR